MEGLGLGDVTPGQSVAGVDGCIRRRRRCASPSRVGGERTTALTAARHSLLRVCALRQSPRTHRCIRCTRSLAAVRYQLLCGTHCCAAPFCVDCARLGTQSLRIVPRPERAAQRRDQAAQAGPARRTSAGAFASLARAAQPPYGQRASAGPAPCGDPRIMVHV